MYRPKQEAQSECGPLPVKVSVGCSKAENHPVSTVCQGLLSGLTKCSFAICPLATG